MVRFIVFIARLNSSDKQEIMNKKKYIYIYLYIYNINLKSEVNGCKL